MIKSFRCRESERIFHRRFAEKFPTDIQQRAFMKLNAIDAAIKMTDGGFASFGEADTRNRSRLWTITEQDYG